MNEKATTGADRVEPIALVWLLVPRKKVSPSDMARGLAKLLGETKTAQTKAASELVARLRSRGLVTPPRALALTDQGRAKALSLLGVSELPRKVSWKWVQQVLVLQALELPFTPVSHKHAANADWIAAHVVLKHLGKHLGVAVRGEPSLLKVGQALAWRAFDKEPKKNLAFHDAFAALFADKAAPAPASAPIEPSLADLDLPGFAAKVMEAARSSPTGRWHDNKIFISHVWAEIQRRGWAGAMTLDAFRERLLEAQKAQLMTLSRADLVQAMSPEDVAASEIAYLNATFHLIRLDL